MGEPAYRRDVANEEPSEGTATLLPRRKGEEERGDVGEECIAAWAAKCDWPTAHHDQGKPGPGSAEGGEQLMLPAW